MLIAYNNDVQHNNRWYHIQTEDNGIKDGHITTTVFYSGQILDSKTTSYKDAIAGIDDEEKINAIIKDMMIKQHQAYYRRLDEGNYDNVSKPATHGPAATASKVAVVSPSMAAANGQKPDILRASQQVQGISKSAGMHSMSSISPRADLSSAPGQVSQPSKVSGAHLSSISSGSAQPKSITTPRIVQSISVPRSKAVEAVRLSVVNYAYKGIAWPTDDLAIDVLVVSMLEKA